LVPAIVVADERSYSNCRHVCSMIKKWDELASYHVYKKLL
jgi:hypothetical protein